MSGELPQNVSGLVAAWSAGDDRALDALVSALYPELRRIARQHLRRLDINHSLESAALANEAYLKLVHAQGIHCEGRARFLGLCAQIMRRILVDHARGKGSAKRGGGGGHIPLDESVFAAAAPGADLIALDDALVALSKNDARKSRVVELRYFGGLTEQEIAEVLGVSPETVRRDWRMAKAWLFRELAARKH